MTIQQMLLAGVGAFKVDSAKFNPVVNITRGAGMTGDADGKQGIFSGWFRLDANDGVQEILFENSLSTSSIATRFQILRNASNQFSVLGFNAASTGILSMNTVGTYVAGTTWRHVLMSWDLLAGASHLYINDVSDKSVATLTNDTINYAQGNWQAGAAWNGLQSYNGCMAEVWFAENQFLDFSVIANRRKFISAAGKPVRLGVNGETPLGGTKPIAYFHLDKSETASNFAINRGTGGNFSVNNISGGSVATGSTSPSD